MNRSGLFAIGACILLLSAACLLFSSCGEEGDNDNGAETPALSNSSLSDSGGRYDPEEFGPYLVGNRSLIFVDPDRQEPMGKGPRRLLVEVWYPAHPSMEGMEGDSIRNFLMGWDKMIEAILSALVTEQEMENLRMELPSIRDAVPFMDRGPFPVIFFSHGYSSVRFQSHTMAAHLASHGFVVVAPDHTGNAIFTTFPDEIVMISFLRSPEMIETTNRDIYFLIDRLEELSVYDPDGFLEGLVDVEHIGISGHSFGGITASETVKVDRRIDAAANLSCLTFLHFPEGYRTPVMYMMGREDNVMSIFREFMVKGYEITPYAKFWLDFFDAGHYSLTDACDMIPTLAGNGDGCGSGKRLSDGSDFEFIDSHLANRIMNAYLTAFFYYWLKGQDFWAEYLSVNHFPEYMEYQAVFQGYENH